MRPLGAALVCLALLLGAPRAEAAPPAPSVTESFRKVRVLVAPRQGAGPTIAVCAASRAGSAEPTPQEVAWTESRGGRVEPGMGETAQCVALPSSELPFGMWLARKWIARAPAPTALGRARARLAELAAERNAAAETTPDVQAAIAVVGRIHPDEITRIAGETAPTLDDAPATAEQRSERLSVLEDARVVAPELHVAYPCTGATTDDLAALGVVAVMLAAGDESRIPSLVVHRRGRATEAFAWFDAPGGTPLFGISVTIAPHSSIDKVERYVDGTLKQLRLVGPSPAELAVAVRTFENRLLHFVESPSGEARLLAGLALAGRDPVPPAALIASARRASPDTVRDVARRYLVTSRRSVVEMYPPDWAIDDTTLEGFTLHTVALGDTWAALAKRFGVPASAILQANELDARFRPSPGEAIWIPPAQR